MTENSSSNGWLNWCGGLLAVAALVSVGSNIYLHKANLALQDELATRQQFINESIRLSRFNTELIQALATLAVQTNDQSISTLLTNHGISYSVNQNQAAANATEAEDE